MTPIRNFPAVFLLLAAIPLLFGCDTVSTGPDDNLPPETELTGGPEPNDAVSYRADLHWTGEDPDGLIVYYEYAVDDTSEWTRAVGGGSSFLFSCGEDPFYDTLTAASGADSVVERSGAVHSFWVRAVDNEGERDPSPAWISFNAITVLPWARITQSPGHGGISGTSVRIRWTGYDPDGTTERPTEYDYFHGNKSVLRETYGYDDQTGVTRAVWNALDWIRVDADCTYVDLRNLTTGFSGDGGNRHMFFVRAIDEAGAVEQMPEVTRNWVEWGAGGLPPQPVIHSNYMGWMQGDDPVRAGIAFLGGRPRFAWGIGDVDPYALDLAGYRYAYDTPLWTPSEGYDPAALFFPPEGETFPFEEEGRHVLSVEAGFLPEGSAGAEYPVDVYPAPPAATAIFHLNDFYLPGYSGQYPGPDQYVAYWRDTLLASFEQLQARTPRMEGATDPPVFRMSEASTVVLTFDDGEFGPSQISIWNALQIIPIWPYVDAGGNLLIAGFMPAWNFLPDRDIDFSGPVPMDDPCFSFSNYGNCGGYLVWHQPVWIDWIPADDPAHIPFSHPLYEFCALETTWLDETTDRLVAAEGLHGGLPDLAIDTSRSPLLADYGGLWKCEELTIRDDAGAVPLYAPVREEGGAAADRPNAVWIPSDGHRGHVVFLSMPLWFFPPGDARQAVETILEDFFGETPKR